MRTEEKQDIHFEGLLFERIVLRLQFRHGNWQGVVRFQQQVWEVEKRGRYWEVTGPAATYYSMGGSQAVLNIV